MDTNVALNFDEAEMLLFAFDEDLDTQIDAMPFGVAVAPVVQREESSD